MQCLHLQGRSLPLGMAEKKCSWLCLGIGSCHDLVTHYTSGFSQVSSTRKWPTIALVTPFHFMVSQQDSFIARLHSTCLYAPRMRTCLYASMNANLPICHTNANLPICQHEVVASVASTVHACQGFQPFMWEAL